MTTIFDADGRPLAEGVARFGEDPRIARLEDVEAAGPLLTYVFGRGERRVMVELDGMLVPGEIDTRWCGSDRIWWVTLEAPVIVDKPSAPAPSRSTEPAGLAGARPAMPLER